VAEGVIVPAPEPAVPALPLDFKAAVKSGKVRKATNIISTICDDRGAEPSYGGVPISEVMEQGLGMGDVIGLLWFKRRLPKYASRFIETCLVMVADHGPCVSGAHNTIVASRAGKDLVSSVASGLLTIGPRFGGAIDDAARYFKAAIDGKLTPAAFVASMKTQGLRIPGIGHRIKSRDNPDARVVLLKEYASSHFSRTKYLDYALAVEQLTLQKSANLILNVDGCIGVLFLDLLYSLNADKKGANGANGHHPNGNGVNGDHHHHHHHNGANGDHHPNGNGNGHSKDEVMFTESQIQEIVDIGYVNGLFVLGRTVGLVGHALDQKRLKQPLYRHPWDDVLYDV